MRHPEQSEISANAFITKYSLAVGPLRVEYRGSISKGSATPMSIYNKMQFKKASTNVGLKELWFQCLLRTGDSKRNDLILLSRVWFSR